MLHRLRRLLSRPRKTPPPSAAALRAMSPLAVTKLLSGDPAQAAPWVRAAARAGSTQAQVRLARMLLTGTGLPQNQEEAYRWFATAARDHDIDAMNMLGRCHENAWGTQQNMQQAAHWYTRAAEKGDAWAQYNLGHLYLDGNGVPPNPQTAFACYSAAAAQGHPRALNLVGRCHEQGWGTPKNPQAAAAAYKASAEAGYFRGQYNHATILLAAGRADEARAWLRRAAETAPPETAARIMSMLSRIDSQSARAGSLPIQLHTPSAAPTMPQVAL